MNQQDRISGNVRECLSHFFEHGALGSLADYMQVGVEELAFWKDNPPKGIPLWMIAYFIENEGYAVAELSSLPPAIYKFGKLLFARLLTVKEVIRTHGCVITSRSALLDMFRRPHKRSEQFCTQLDRIYSGFMKSHPDVLENKSGKITPLSLHQMSTLISASVKRMEPVQGTVDGIVIGKKTIVDLFASLVEAALPLGQKILSGDFSPEQRYELRVTRLAGGKLAKFADIVNALTSEHARENQKPTTTT